MCGALGLHRDEEGLVELAKQGSAAAFGEIYDRYVSLVYRYAQTLLGSRSEAEDLTAETFLRALQAIKEYRWTGRPVSSWLLTIARNLAINHLRRKQRAKDALCLLAVSASSDPVELGGREGVDLQDLPQAILALSPVERDVIILRFVLDLDYPQVSQVVSKSVNNVRVIQHRALRRLHQNLTSAGAADFLVA
jgi:RNA polymerase sigma-70 factor (ECF subfamily)